MTASRKRGLTSAVVLAYCLASTYLVGVRFEGQHNWPWWWTLHPFWAPVMAVLAVCLIAVSGIATLTFWQAFRIRARTSSIKTTLGEHGFQIAGVAGDEIRAGDNVRVGTDGKLYTAGSGESLR